MAVAGLISPMFITISLALAVIVLSLVSSGVAQGTSDSGSGSLPFPVRTVYQFPVGTFVENLAVRSNGQILVTLLTSPNLFLLNSNQTGQPTLVHSFDGYESLSGIAEYKPDIFVVMTGNFTLAALNFAPSTWAVWRVDMRTVQQQGDGTLSPAPLVSKIADVPNVFLNGMSLLSEDQGTILLADFAGGQIFRLNVDTGDVQLVIANTLTASASLGSSRLTRLGVDGVHVRGDSVYFTNAGKKIFVRQPINKDGTPNGNGVILANATWQFDDFNFDNDGNAYLVTAGSGNSILRVSPDGSHQQIVAGDVNSTLIAQPTSAAFGRGPCDQNTLYVTSAGGLLAPIDGSIIVGGQVLAISTDAKGAPTLYGLDNLGGRFSHRVPSPKVPTVRNSVE